MSIVKFTTPVHLTKSDINISHEIPVLLIGSCFAQNIGTLLKTDKFDVSINANGIIYNPISIVNALHRIIKNDIYTEEVLTFYNKWVSFAHHGSFSSANKEDVLANINQSLHNAHQTLKKANALIITFGSAWVYEHDDFGIVANCHKLPAKKFNKRLLTVEEIVTAYTKLIKAIDPKINIVFTVSPVRHIKDGLHENNLSKSVLHLAVKNITEQHKNCSYFPAYEIVTDELRDYRFYKDDLVHPTDMAINYVWEKFSAAYFDKDTTMLNEAIQHIVRAANHRPFQAESEAHQKFVKAFLFTIDKINEDFPFLDFSEEKEKLKCWKF